MSFDEDRAHDPAYAPLIEAGEGESEGFELAEQDLIEHASHGDEHAARRVIQDAFGEAEDPRAFEIDGEPDSEAKPDLGGTPER
ncbi:MAG TPA: hypothetical protein VFN48_07560 [Solirubrobacteraceae bacterium]|nr:hypothetical protein [Solirubrobacteraceae bacterium]